MVLRNCVLMWNRPPPFFSTAVYIYIIDFPVHPIINHSVFSHWSQLVSWIFFQRAPSAEADGVNDNIL